MADAAPDLAALQSLNASAYHWYAHPALVRADDLLVRSRAGEALCRAADALARLETEARHAMPAPSRAHPFPTADAARPLQRLRHLHDRIKSLETRLRGGGSLPDKDFSTSHGVSQPLREKLVACDAALIAAADAVAAADPGALEPALGELEQAIDSRATLIANRVGCDG
jgi:hypothetical protein